MRDFFPSLKERPVIEKISCALTPEQVFSFFAGYDRSAFLNSSMQTDTSRYSFIGIDPFFSVKAKGALAEIRFSGHKIKVFGNPLKILKSASNAYRVVNDTPFPFVAGGAGYFSYEAKNLMEKLPEPSLDDMGMPDIFFSFYRAILIFDRKTPGEFYISALDIASGSDVPAREVISRVKQTVKKSLPDDVCFSTGKRPYGQKSLDNKGILHSNFTREGYTSAVERVLEHIREGDIYQACLSQRFNTLWQDSAYRLYAELDRINPSPFGAYLNVEDFTVISSSPELFLRRRGDTVETRPMKGTRPRGVSPEEDESNRRDLDRSGKDISELLMIVDLERNDMGKLALPGTIKVAEQRRIETYPTVFQAISVITGKVRDDTDNMDILEASFPGGSITGCPKIRAMEIINDIEGCARGVYTGSIGYLSFHGTMDMNIAIRTMILKGNDLYFYAGGGIVAESDPGAEYEETLVKARALMDAVGIEGQKP